MAPAPQNDQTPTDLEAAAFLTREPRASEASLQRIERQLVELETRVAQALAEFDTETPAPENSRERTWVWGVPFSHLNLRDVLLEVHRRIQAGVAGYFITANLNYCMLTRDRSSLDAVNGDADFIVCDGTPILWWSRWLGAPLPERVAGSELIYALAQSAAKFGHRVFFLGGAPGVAQRAADQLRSRHPNLIVAGVESPPFRPLTPDEESELLARIRASRAQLIFVAFGQPKGEAWMARNRLRWGPAIAVQLGASFDFVAGGVPRAPRWMQKLGLEWAYRMWQEPKRLAGRYARNASFLARSVFRDIRTGARPNGHPRKPGAS